MTTKITKENDNLNISITVPLTMKGEYTYGDGEWEAPAVCIFIDEKRGEYGLFHTQYLDYKDSLQATAPIVFFDTKEEAMKVADDSSLPVQFARV